MADTPQDAETAAREALITTAAETLRLYGEFGTNRSREIEQSEAAARAVLALRPASSPGEVTWQPTHQHVKRGSTYQLVGHARLQASTGPAGDDTYLALYKGEDGSMWARPAHEFLDGRFASLLSTTQTEAGNGR